MNNSRLKKNKCTAGPKSLPRNTKDSQYVLKEFETQKTKLEQLHTIIINENLNVKIKATSLIRDLRNVQNNRWTFDIRTDYPIILALINNAESSLNLLRAKSRNILDVNSQFYVWLESQLQFILANYLSVAANLLGKVIRKERARPRNIVGNIYTTRKNYRQLAIHHLDRAIVNLYKDTNLCDINKQDVILSCLVRLAAASSIIDEIATLKDFSANIETIRQELDIAWNLLERNIDLLKVERNDSKAEKKITHQYSPTPDYKKSFEQRTRRMAAQGEWWVLKCLSVQFQKKKDAKTVDDICTVAINLFSQFFWASETYGKNDSKRSLTWQEATFWKTFFSYSSKTLELIMKCKKILFGRIETIDNWDHLKNLMYRLSCSTSLITSRYINSHIKIQSTLNIELWRITTIQERFRLFHNTIEKSMRESKVESQNDFSNTC